MPNSEYPRTEEFVQLWTRHAQGLFAYINTLVFDLSLAEDLLQETAAVAWKQFDDFESGTNFRAWAAKIAFNKSVAALKKQRQTSAWKLDLLELEQFSESVLQDSSNWDLQLESLHTCLKELKPRDRELLRERYSLGRNVLDIADRRNCSTSTIYKSLEAIHEWLFHCVSRKLRQEATS